MAVTARVPVEPGVLEWAVQRSGREPDEFERFPLEAWETGSRLPTFRQLSEFARATYTPVGYLLLTQPPGEFELPIEDFRTVGGRGVDEPSPHLLDTLSICQQRQDWYREFLIDNGDDPLRFVGSMTTQVPPRVAAAAMADTLEFDPGQNAVRDAGVVVSALSDLAENLGVLVMISGIVGNNTHRPLDPDEFRGFTLADPYAPLVFVNGVDAKTAQLFTLAHELGHVWLGESGVSNAAISATSNSSVERWCNEVAAELLVPAEVLTRVAEANGGAVAAFDRIARRFAVSREVIAYRLHDLNLVDRATFQNLLARARQRSGDEERSSGSSGGNYYNTQPRRLSPRFTRALIQSTYEGRTLWRDAFRLSGSAKPQTLQRMGERLGVL